MRDATIRPPPLPCLVALTASLLPGVALTAPQVQHYDLSLAINPSTLSLDATATLQIQATPSQGSVSTVDLDLVGLTVSAVTWNGATAPFTRNGSTLSIALPSALPAGSTGSLKIAYAGIPDKYPTDQGDLGLMQDKNTTFAINVTEGARYWFPARDRLDDKASVTLHLILPRGQLSAGPGHLESVTPVDTAREKHTWSMSQPVTPYLISFAFSDRYERDHYQIDSTYGPHDVDVLLQPETWTTGATSLAALPDMVTLMEDRYGPFPYDQIGFHEIPFAGAVEQPGNISMGTLYWSGLSTMEPYFAHELAHTWFQGLVTIRSWNDIFMSESVAAWHELLWTEASQDVIAADQLAQIYLASYLSALPDEGTFPLFQPEVLFGYTVYVKGPLVVRLLDHLMGRPLLTDAFRQYLAAPEGVSDLDTFMDLIESSGLSDIANFRAEWIDRGGLPDYRFGWKSGPSGTGWGLALNLTQPGNTLYTTPIDIHLTLADGSTRIETLHPTTGNTVETRCLEQEVVAASLDPRYMVPRGQTGSITYTGSADSICSSSPACGSSGRFAKSPLAASIVWVLGLPGLAMWRRRSRPLNAKRRAADRP